MPAEDEPFTMDLDTSDASDALLARLTGRVARLELD